MLIAQACLGILAFFLFAFLLSEDRWSIQKSLVIKGFSIQIILALIFTQFPLVRQGFSHLTRAIEALKNATEAGTSFVFGYLGGGQVPFEAKSSTFIFAFQALPMIMVVSALSMLLFYWGWLPWIVSKIAYFWRKALNIGGALGTAAAAKVFLGNIEAPLVVRPYLKYFSRAELFALITCGMATTSATLMVLYATLLKDVIHAPMGHILTASMISIPAAIVMAHIVIPQKGDTTSGELVAPYQFSNWMDAISKGTGDGLTIFLNITAFLIVALALVALSNSFLSLLPAIRGESITLQSLFGIAFAPVTWLMGIPWSECFVAGKLLGTKTVLNEIVAFVDMKHVKDQLSPTNATILMYGLCGFANFSAVGIVIGGMGAMVPERRPELVELSLKSMVTGTLATCLSGTIIGIISRLLES